MSARRLLSDAVALKALAERLSTCEAVTRLDEGGEREAWTLTHALGDLEESLRRFLEDQLPRLTGGQLEGSEINDLFLEMGEEFRSVLSEYPQSVSTHCARLRRGFVHLLPSHA